VASGNN